MEEQPKDSGLVSGIRSCFDLYKGNDSYRYVMVFYDGWNDVTSYKAIKKGQYPWVVHDHFMSSLRPDQNATKMVLGFDLEMDFDEQFPSHLRENMQVFDGLLMQPVSWIPNRQGVVPERERQKVMEDILRPKPRFKLV